MVKGMHAKSVKKEYSFTPSPGSVFTFIQFNLCKYNTYLKAIVLYILEMFLLLTVLLSLLFLSLF